MKRILKLICIVILFGFVGIQFMGPDRNNPPINETDRIEATGEVPDHVFAIISRSCKDCHSHETRYPWYSNIVPISWSVADHVRVGRENLNFSNWGTYSRSGKQRKLKEICKEVESRQMPHSQYLWIHREAVLTDSDIEALCNWTKTYFRKIVDE